MNPNKELSASQPRIVLTIWMIVAQLVSLITLAGWLIFVGVSVLFADSKITPLDILPLLPICLYPIFPLGLSIAAWFAFVRRKNILAAILIGLAAAPILFILIGMLTLIV